MHPREAGLAAGGRSYPGNINDAKSMYPTAASTPLGWGSVGEASRAAEPAGHSLQRHVGQVFQALFRFRRSL